MIAISACLAGIPCRYDGRSKPHAACQAMLLAEGALLVCPECLGGLPTPRPPAELPGGSAQDVWEGKRPILNREGQDVTEAYMAGAQRLLALCQRQEITEVWLKAKSPACGCGKVYDGSYSGRLVDGDGLAAALLKRNGIRVICVD